MEDTLTVTVLRGPGLLPLLDDVARLRIGVFNAWPYLYEGSLDYERDYLAAYAATADAVCVVARAGGEVVGASTGLPLLDDGPAFRQPFEAAGIDPAQVFYFGESVLLPAWRGRGIGHAFFDAREAHARALGRFAMTAFCVVDREADDPRRPPGHRDNDAFWHKRGYARRPGMTLHLRWQEAGRGEVLHPLTFWTRMLEPAA
ncbi:GNAT family acetyltransferase [Stenotrophomonas daejeonensis]|uniref:GNAT family acetyltransferase n=1 Tax=Stenotrophomonas daejeonensis TaxID=659018 RepID=A0A0R0DXZ2_9GAMM|nr:GNAT family N-acetyltransferase [Stenotrophomonas daejeonensis]KRG82833.1 GNAT family acetyltransferase [Stenotrophomonas daejeonensis]